MSSINTKLRLLPLPLFLSTSALALAAEWDGDTSTDWFDGENWVNGSAPIEAENIIIDTITSNPTIVSGGPTPILGILYVGNEATGMLTIRDGGTVSSGLSRIGFASGSEGILTVTGPGSTWTSSHFLEIGYGGTGALTIRDGGTVSSLDGRVGRLSGSNGLVTVSGVGSNWTANSNSISVGRTGTGTMIIEDGGAVSSSWGLIGVQSGSDGAVTVSGPQSKWTMSGRFLVSDLGKSILMIENGGTVSNADATIGRDSGSNGAVMVTGPGSRWINSLSLTVGSVGTGIGTMTIGDGGFVDVAGTTYVARSGSSTGTVNIGAAAREAAIAPGTLNTALVQFGSGTGSLVFNHTDVTGTYAFTPGISSGSGTTAIDHYAGFTRLTGDSSASGMPTNIHGGTLAIDNILGGYITVTDGGTVSGTGTASGKLAFNTGSYYLVEMDGTHADQGLTVGVGASLAGTVMLTGDYDAQLGQEIVILTSPGFGSTFADVVVPSVFMTPTLNYDTSTAGAHYVKVTVDQTVAFGDLAQTHNQRSLASGLDTLASGNSLFDTLILLESEGAARDAYDQMSGEAHASLMGALMENSQQAVSAVNDRIHATFEAEAGERSTAAYGDTIDGENGFWLTGYGNWTDTDATSNTAQMDNTLGGFVAGIDREVGNNARLGLLGGYSQTSTRVDALASSGDADSYTIGVYGGAEKSTGNGTAGISFGALYTWHSIETTRQVTIPVTETLAGDYDARSYQFFAEAGYEVKTDRFALEPFAGVSYINLKTDAYSETGGISALSAGTQTNDTTYTTLGLRSSLQLADRVNTRGMVGWRHAFGDVDPASTFTIAGSTPFTVLGAPIAEDAAVTELGLDVNVTDNVMIGASYEGQYGDGATAHGFNARMLAIF